jgi:O-antigen ligase
MARRGLYASSVGLRLGLWTWAWQLFEAHPVIGVGTGDFESTVNELPAFQAAVSRAIEIGRVEGRAADDAAILDYLSRGHAHSTYLHTLAQLGLIGAAALAALLLLVLRHCARDEADHVYADGTLFVVLAWMIGAQFDCYELNGHLFELLGLAIAATWPYRPPVAAPFFRLGPHGPALTDEDPQETNPPC